MTSLQFHSYSESNHLTNALFSLTSIEHVEHLTVLLQLFLRVSEENTNFFSPKIPYANPSNLLSRRGALFPLGESSLRLELTFG